MLDGYHGGVRLFATVFLSVCCAAPALAQSRTDLAHYRGMEAERLVDQLRDDDIRWNAELSVRVVFGRLSAEAALGADGPLLRALFAALDSDDRQQRDMAGQILVRELGGWRERTGLWPWPQEQVHRVLRVAVGQLGGADSWWASAPVSGAYGFLLPVVAEARPYLEEALRLRRNGSTTFFSAVLLSHTGDATLLPEAAPVLVEALRHNGVRWDAILALPALYRFGPATIPYLQRALPGADEQQRACIELLLLDYASPPVTRADHFRRRRLNRITWKVSDPAVEQADPYLLH